MVDLSVKIGKFELKNPFILEAGPTTRTGEHLKLAGEAGWGAATTKTIINEPFEPFSRFISKTADSILNTDAASEFTLERWVDKELKIAKEGDIPIIANVYFPTSPPWTNDKEEDVIRIVKTLYSAGINLIEIAGSGGCPVMWAAGFPADKGETLTQVITAIRKAADMEIIVKFSGRAVSISPNDTIELAKAAEKSGAAAVCITDAIGYSTSLDIETGEPKLGYPGLGAVSGAAIREFAVGCTIELARSVNIPIIGIGGIMDGKDAIERFLAGAKAVGVCTSSILNTTSVVQSMLNDLEIYMKRKSYERISDFSGLSIKKLAELADKKDIRLVADIDENLCGECKLFLNYNTSWLQRMDLCSGCGMCAAVCPSDCISMESERAVPRKGCVNCGLCITVCPRTTLLPQNFPHKVDDIDFGPTIEVFQSRSSDPEILKRAQSGGFTTALLKFCLEKKLFDAVIVNGRDENWKPIPTIVKDPDQLKNFASSKYALSPTLAICRDLIKDEEIKSAVVVALGCQVEALRKIQSLSKLEPDNLAVKISEKIGLIIGLRCWSPHSRRLYPEVLQNQFGVDLSQISKVDLMPESFNVFLQNGEKKEFSPTISRPYALPACQVCDSLSNNLADIAVGGTSTDADPGWTGVMVRTPKGQEIVKKAKENGYLEVSPKEINLEAPKAEAYAKRTYSVYRKFIRPVRRCVESCNWGAITAPEDGVPSVDPNKCSACSFCTYQCPSGAIKLTIR
jgi:coenzyme F420-reducing hydrogenase beta subunit/dihydroorotate dehydrogenase